MDTIRKYAERHGWTYDHVLCSYDYVVGLLPKTVQRLSLDVNAVLSYIEKR